MFNTVDSKANLSEEDQRMKGPHLDEQSAQT